MIWGRWNLLLEGIGMREPSAMRACLRIGIL